MLRQLSSPAILEIVEPICNTNPRQQMEPPVNSQKAIYLWLQLFYDIFNDEQLIGKLQNTLKMTFRTEGKLEESIVANLIERNANMIQIRKRRIGRQF
jgi:hypothetical protein